jgi:hypothetical protein
MLKSQRIMKTATSRGWKKVRSRVMDDVGAWMKPDSDSNNL